MKQVRHVEITPDDAITVAARPDLWQRFDRCGANNGDYPAAAAAVAGKEPTRDVRVDRDGRMLWYYPVGDWSIYPDDLRAYQVDADLSMPIARVPRVSESFARMFYTDGRNPLTRFWITGEPNRNADGSWQIKCPLSFNDEPLFAFANFIYAIEPVKAPYHSYNGLSEMAVSSEYSWAWPRELQEANVKPQPASNRLIDDFARGGRDWSRSGLDNSYWWNINTRKINCPLFTGPKGAELVFEFNSPEAGAKIGVVVNRSFMEANWVEDRFYGFFDLPQQGWNTVRVKVSDLHNPYGWQLDDWHKLNTLTIRAAGGLKEEIEKNWLPAAKRVSEQVMKDGSKSAYAVSTGALPDKVSGWNESYYKTAGDEYTKGTNMTPDDVFVKTRFGNMRWDGGEYVQRSKPYVEEKFLKPEPVK